MSENQLLERIIRLEQANRNLRRVLLTAILLVGIPSLLGAGFATRAIPERIQAREIDIVDSAGRVRAVLNSRSLRLNDENGLKRIDLGKDEGANAGAGLSLYDSNGKNIVDVTVTGWGDGGLVVSDDTGRSRADIGTFAGSPALGVYGSDGKTEATMEASGASASVGASSGNSAMGTINVGSGYAGFFMATEAHSGVVIGTSNAFANMPMSLPSWVPSVNKGAGPQIILVHEGHTSWQAPR
ncbi:MAG TPA: hypothetical protein VKS20_06880 [Candidatus Acidoferrales bacterium]|nr:hypothetical protein [Candidatus Acidoferrales bacterium]